MTDDNQVNKSVSTSSYQQLSTSFFFTDSPSVMFLKLWLKKPHNIKFTIRIIGNCVVQQGYIYSYSCETDFQNFFILPN